MCVDRWIKKSPQISGWNRCHRICHCFTFFLTYFIFVLELLQNRVEQRGNVHPLHSQTLRPALESTELHRYDPKHALLCVVILLYVCVHLKKIKEVTEITVCLCVCRRGVVHPAAVWRAAGVVGQAAQRVSQLPHAERVAKKGVFASNHHPELRQGEGELEHTAVLYHAVYSHFLADLMESWIFLFIKSNEP